ncbi:hypothetical protein RND81_03G090600 [Saponaria officinalis]|uniref:Endonuclease/exonuclease/phosphatase domain-containing protein n=1 Tax=Saponaria officinalis TaxID=3572 RepID=A0AAW1LZJ4_SAPOF
MNDFRSAIDDCGLLDLGYVGDPFTWWNKQSEPNDIYEGLDRALVKPDWVDLHPTLLLHHLARESSDHNPIKISRPTNTSRRKRRYFKFEDVWVTSANCEEVVRDAWTDHVATNGDAPEVMKIKRCAAALTKWSWEEFGDITKKLSKARKRLAFIDSCRPTEDMVTERRNICSEIDKLLTQEEIYWRHRSRCDFLKDGD